MYLISFRWFKENCLHVDHDYDFNKTSCSMEHDHKELFARDPETRETHYHYPCKEKYCPVLEACKREK